MHKTFYVREADRQKPQHKNWQLILPGPGTKEPLRIHFLEPIDHALASNSISIWRNGDYIKGNTPLNQKETVWEYSPEKKWDTGRYVINIASRLEGLAGNNMNRLFEKDL